MKMIKLVCGLAALLAAIAVISGSAMAFTIENGTVKVAASDVVLDQSSTSSWDQSFSGYDYRFQYSRLDDKYAQNGDIANPTLSGWSNALYSVNNMSTLLTWDNYKYIGLTSLASGDTGEAIYKFDLSGTGRTIDQLYVTNSTSIWYAGDNCYAEYSVSTDGLNWNVYGRPTVDATNTQMGTPPYYDITSYVSGSSVYYIKLVVAPFSYDDKVQLLRHADYDHFDNKVWLSAPATVPEPGAMLGMFTGLIGFAGFSVRRRK